MKSSKRKAVLVRAPYSFEIYRAAYRSRFKIGHKQVEPPLALMQIGAALMDAGHDVRIIDGEAENLSLDELVDRACRELPDVIGVTGTTPEFGAAKYLLEETKRRLPHVITVIGGAHATHVPWEIAEQVEGIDYVVIYEGEKSMRAIVGEDSGALKEYSDNAQHLLRMVGTKEPRRFESIVLFGLNQSVEDLEGLRPLRELPYIDMSYYKYADPQLGLVTTQAVETARGCPYGCTFCSSARSGLGMRSVENVLEELEYIQSGFRKADHRGFVIFLDDTLTFSRQRSSELFEGIVRRQMRMHYKAFTRANTIATKNGYKADLEFAKLMKRAGFTIISFGIETGNEKINRAMNKGVTLDDYRKAYEILDEVGFEERRGSFIVGHPHETESTVKESIAFAHELRLHRIGVNIMTPYPGTKVYDSARRGNGLYFEENAREYGNYRRWGSSVVSTDELSGRALEYWHKRFLAEIYTSPPALNHGVNEFLSGNRSRFYHRPVYEASKDRLRMLLSREWQAPPKFERPDHSRYAPDEWGVAHITKTDCAACLREIYQMPLSRQPKISIPQLS